jgi:hypothetical protein
MGDLRKAAARKRTVSDPSASSVTRWVGWNRKARASPREAEPDFSSSSIRSSDPNAVSTALRIRLRRPTPTSAAISSSVRPSKLLARVGARARASFNPTQGEEQPANGVLALPPIQRNAAWNPRQVVEVWDSVFRGLPLGSFMLQRRGPDGQGRGPGADARIHRLPEGWDLLDGQQRLRSLLLGRNGPDRRQDKRCLWLNLDATSARYLFDLRLTSASQPFGYDEEGYKLPQTLRARARARFEPENSEIKTPDRLAHTHELFEGFLDRRRQLRLVQRDQSSPIPPDAYPDCWPPPPANVDLNDLYERRSVLPLHEVLSEWTKGQGRQEKEELLTALLREHHSSEIWPMRWTDLIEQPLQS